jgi:hypothetical protein
MIRGSCHCGAVRYTADIDPTEALECNCSICRRNGYLLAFATPDTFTLETTRNALETYTFNKHVVRHQFCTTCGSSVSGEGDGPNGPTVAINMRCVEDFDLGALKINPYDGASV